MGVSGAVRTFLPKGVGDAIAIELDVVLSDINLLVELQ